MNRRLQLALSAVGARLKRHRKHLIYELPNGKNVVISSTPSDCRADNNAIRQIQRVSGTKPEKVIKEPRERRDKPGRREAEWSRPVLAAALDESGIAGPYYTDRIAALERENKDLAIRGDRWCAIASNLDGELLALRANYWVRLGMWLRLVTWGVR